jgi:hypothetical protein
MYERADARAYGGHHLDTIYRMVTDFWGHQAFPMRLVEHKEGFYSLEGIHSPGYSTGIEMKAIIEIEAKGTLVEVRLRYSACTKQPGDLGVGTKGPTVLLMPVVVLWAGIPVCLYEYESHQLIDAFWRWLTDMSRVQGVLVENKVIKTTAIHAPTAAHYAHHAGQRTLSGDLDHFARSVGRDLDRVFSGGNYPQNYYTHNPSNPLVLPVLLDELTKETRLQLLEQRFLMGDLTEATYKELKERYSKDQP